MYFGLILLWAGLIFYLSAQPGLRAQGNNVLEMALRKTAHFSEFGLLGFLLWQFFYKCQSPFQKSIRQAIIWATLYAFSDEIHQLFVAGRTGKFIDVFIDFLGIWAALRIISIVHYQRKKDKKILAIILLAFFLTVSWLAYSSSPTFKKHYPSKSQLSKTEAINNFPGKSSKDESQIKNKSNTNPETDLQKLNQKQPLPIKKDLTIEGETDVNKDEKEHLPTKIVIPNIPFTCQAPFAHWDQLHEESCEEASLVMLYYFHKNQPLSKNLAEKEIQNLVKFQLENYGNFFDTSIQKTAKLAKDYYHLDNLKILNNPTILSLKRELALGHPILAPTAGRLLKNPYFTPPGPLYHNLVIIGYDDRAVKDSSGHKAEGVFIVNDPGTRRGAGYRYDQKTLWRAIHDFPGDKKQILQGPKKVLVLITADK